MNNDKSRTTTNIILFLCNWGPHAAFQKITDNGGKIPSCITMVRIPCTGRISKALLLKPFEMGADGVALVGCEPGSCRYGPGTITARNNSEDIRGILELLGLGEERMRLATFLPDESQELLDFLTEFAGYISCLEKSRVTPFPKEISFELDAEEVKDIVTAHDIYSCQDCGKCSSACSLTLAGKDFSPRAMASSIIAGDCTSTTVQNDVWSCLTCGLCYDRCPSAVNFPDFICDMRYVLKKGVVKEFDSHGGFFQSLMRTMTSENLKTKHWNWLPEEIQVDPDSKRYFFGGCAPYFDLFFRKHLKGQTSNILVDGLRLLNFFDIVPAIIEDERCCGHDLLWAGNKNSFLKLARLNADRMHELGVEELITACPECYRTFKHDYPSKGIEVNFKVTHIFDLLEKEIDKGAIGFEKLDRNITFQDPCRLSRFEERADLPRKLINRLDSDSFNEMRNNSTSAICCGNSAWTGCDSFSKSLQVKRLKEAHDTGSDLLVTACPKCQIHLRCAMEDPFLEKELEMEMMDLTSLLANTIRWE